LLKKRGIVPVEHLDDIDHLPVGATMIIRAHGISPTERKRIRDKGFRIVDATCPRVGRVQAIIRKHAAAGYRILIAGDREHPEVNGLLGFAGGQGVVLGAAAEVDDIPEGGKVCVVAQTTQNLEEYAAICDRVRQRFPETVVFDTICDSTEKRQKEIKSLAAASDAVVIVGGRNSANTQRLVELARLERRPTFHIETDEELSGIDIEPYERIGVSAGASTPNWIINRVIDRLTARRGKKEKFFRHIFKVWGFAVRTDLWSALGAGCLSLVATLLQGLTVNLLPILTASLYVFAMHVLYRFINRRTSSISSFRQESYLLHEKVYIALAVASMILALGAARLSGIASFLLLFTITCSGLLYGVTLLPRGFRFQRLRDIPGSKNITTAVAWAAVTALLPRVEAGFAVTPGLAVAFVVSAGMVFIRSALSDILDIQRDRLIGLETLPVLIGEKRTIRLLQGGSGVLFALLVLAVVFGWSTPAGLTLLPAVFYLWICFRLYDRRSGFSGEVLEGLLESSYLVAGIGGLLWLLASRVATP
ncbi:MAG: 4-hydroxy-3-methylbut-2-enyl diphosphate reductase, partial [Syntrophaceae bacterium]|nr:4-hydroxy-3-methylbut-2-enyl diphosphate reductase [Syntrophaceae bacterium]